MAAGIRHEVGKKSHLKALEPRRRKIETAKFKVTGGAGGFTTRLTLKHNQSIRAMQA